MIECIKSMEIKEALKNESDAKCENLVKDLFIEIPTLTSVGFSKTNEYDDSNYSDCFSVKSINRVKLEDTTFVDDEDEQIKELPKGMPDNHYEVPFIISVLQGLSDEYDYGDDHILTREEVLSRPKRRESKNKAFDAFYIALKTGVEVKDLSVFKNNPNWALYYSMDVLKSRLPRELESLFKKDIKYAYYYATKVIKGNLPEMVEKHFLQREKILLLKTFDEEEGDYESWQDKEEKYYLTKYREFITNRSDK